MNVSIPPSVISIGDKTFGRCFSLEEIELPPFLSSIGDQCFCECLSLWRITIPSSVTKIGTSAFGLCRSLECVKFERPLSEIEFGINVFPSYTALLVDSAT